MSIEKTYNEFVVLHEKTLMTKDIDSLEKDIITMTERTNVIIGSGVDDDINKATKKITEGMSLLKKILVKHELYEI